MERLELRGKVISALHDIKQGGIKIINASEISYGESDGKNSLTYRLTVDSNGEPTSIRIDHIWGNCEETINIWHYITEFDPEVITNGKALILQNCWEIQHPNSHFKIAKSDARKELIFGTRIKVSEINPENLPEIIKDNITYLIKETPHAQFLIKKFTELEKKHVQKNPVTE